MDDPTFQPGFRLSSFDVLILAFGLVGALVAGSKLWWAGATIGFVVLHFFLFCNVFRICRSSELVWAAALLGLAVSTINAGVPGWTFTFTSALCLSVVLVILEMRRPSYHGVGWRRLNPKLPEWWAAQGR